MGFRVKKKAPIFSSFTYAISGIWLVLRTERNFQLHSLSGLTAILLGIFSQLNSIEWLFILLAIIGMFVLEMINTAIEKVVDLVTKEYHPLAKAAKDIAAGAVLMYAFLTVIIAIFIFVPKWL